MGRAGNNNRERKTGGWRRTLLTSLRLWSTPPERLPDWMSLVPALWLAGAFTAGDLLALSLRNWPLVAAGTAIFGLPRLRPIGPRRLVVLAAAFLAGLGLTRFRLARPTLPETLPRLPCRVVIEGRVLTPVYAGDALPPEPAWRLRAVVRVRRIATDTSDLRPGLHRIDDRILVEGAACRNFRIGSGVVLAGVLIPPASARFPGDFDYARYLRIEGISAVMKNPRLLRITPPRGGIGKAAATLFRLRDACIDRAVQGLSPDAAALTAAAAFGYRRSMAPETRAFFLRSGLLHIFAVSGLHVGIFAGILLWVARLLRVPYRTRYLMLPLPLLLYVLLTGGRPAAVRAWLMISLWCAGRGMYRAASPLNAIGVAALILLVLNPLNVLRVGFQYSFLVVMVLATGWKWVRIAVLLVTERHPWTPVRYRHRTADVIAFQHLIRIGGASLLAWAGSIGLTAWYNGFFLPWNPLANAAAAPAAWATVCLAFIRAICGFVPGFGWCHALLGHLLPIPASLLQGVTRTFGRAPFCIVCGRPSLGAVLWFYGGLFVLLCGRYRNPRVAAGGLVFGTASLACSLILMLDGCRRPSGPWAAVISGGNGARPVVIVRPHPFRPPMIIDAADVETCRMAGAWLQRNGWGAVDGIVVRRAAASTRRAVAAITRNVDAPWVVTAPAPPTGRSRLPNGILPASLTETGDVVWREATGYALPGVQMRKDRERHSEALAVDFVRFPVATISRVTVTRRTLGETRIDLRYAGGCWSSRFHPTRRPVVRLWRCPDIPGGQRPRAGR